MWKTCTNDLYILIRPEDICPINPQAKQLMGIFNCCYRSAIKKFKIKKIFMGMHKNISYIFVTLSFFFFF